MITGFFGGKFMPLHKGHLYCIDTAAQQCDKVIVVMFINGDEELEIMKTHTIAGKQILESAISSMQNRTIKTRLRII